MNTSFAQIVPFFGIVSATRTILYSMSIKDGIPAADGQELTALLSEEIYFKEFLCSF